MRGRHARERAGLRYAVIALLMLAVLIGWARWKTVDAIESLF